MEKPKWKYFLKIILYLVIFAFTNQTFYSQENESLKSLLLNGKYQTIIDSLEGKVNNQDSLSFDEYNALGKSYLRLMNFQKAILPLMMASKIEPENIKNLLLLGNCYSSAGNTNFASYTYTKVLELDSSNNTALINYGKVLVELEDYKKASKIYQKLIIADSTNSYFYSQLGLCELRKGNVNLAKMNFGKSFQLNRSNAKTVLRLAKLHYNDKNYEAASKLLQFGLSQNSQNKALNRMLADVFYKKKQYEEAIIKYLYGITIGDSTAHAFQKLGMSYYYLSFNRGYQREDVRNLKLKEAIDALYKSYYKDTLDPINSLYLGLCYKELGQHKDAINHLEETLNKVFPDYIDEIFSNLGSSYSESKNYLESIKAYKEALSYNPSKTTLYFYLANVYDNYYEDKNVAVLYYQKFIDKSPDADENLIGYSLNRIKTNLFKELHIFFGPIDISYNINAEIILSIYIYLIILF